MAGEFKPITTQEEFDAAIKARLDRQEATIRKEYSDYDTLKSEGEKFGELKKDFEKKAQEDAAKISELKKSLEESTGKVKAYEVKELKSKAAADIGLPSYLCDRITGTTEEEINADAKKLYEAFSAENRKGLPGFNPEKPPEKPGDAALRDMLAKLKKS